MVCSMYECFMSRLYVSNRRSNSQTFCIVNVEAMSRAVPVVGWGKAGPSDYLRNGTNAALAGKIDIGSFVDAMETLYDEKYRRR